jgi:fructose-1,6-bisphosphatase/inositol monophosphatase family enzyme
MPKDRFRQRLQAFSDEGELTAFNLAVVAEGLDIIQDLNEQNVGGETVEERIGEFKSWDPEVFKVDKDTEDQYTRRLEELDRPVLLLSEEVGTVPLNSEARGQELVVVCDPFDGSYLFKRGIPDFWYSSLALFDESGDPLSCGVGDAVHRNIAFANESGAFIAHLGEDGLEHRFQLTPAYRDLMGRGDVTDLGKASIESYAMKPAKYLLPLMDEYRELMAPFKFFLPNGGPYGFVDVAEGKIDCYFARRQPHVDVFSGIFVAQQAGVVVTDFEGNDVQFTRDVKTLHDVVVTTNSDLHEQVLELIAQCKQKMD